MSIRSAALSAFPLALLAACGSGGGVSSTGPARPADSTGADPAPPAPTPPPTADAAPTPPALRLPGGVAPTKYRATLDIDPARDVFTGDIEIALHIAEPTSFFWLNGSGLTIDAARLSVDGQAVDVETVIAPPAEGRDSGDFIGFRLGRTVPAGDAILIVRYQGAIAPKQYDGVFKQTDRGATYVYSQFEAMAARKAFPCFDEPQLKVPWQLGLVIPDGMMAVSNTAELTDRDGVTADGRRIHLFAETPPLPSYLVAFAVGPFEVVDGGKVGRNKVPSRIIVPAGHTADAAYAVATLPHLITALEDYFDMPLPYDKMDHVAVPQFFGAMENPGMITYAADILLVDAANQTPGAQRRMAAIAAHELAHQWFGDLVTMAWWDDIWLNESFATWMAVKVIETWKPAWHAEVRALQETHGAMRADLQLSTRKIHNPIVTRGDIEGAFDAISYGKGGGVLSMFERWIGADRFRDGVRAYMKQHAWGNATASDFIAAIAAVSDPEVPAAFESFLEQSGVPVISVELTCAASEAPALHVRQERLLAPDETAPAQRWQIPMCVSYDAGGGKTAEQCQLVGEVDSHVALGTAATRCPSWVMANASAAGYYRVDYAAELRDKLVARAAKLAVTERLALASDLSALAGVGKVPAKALLAAVSALAADKNGDVVASVAGIVADLHESQLIPDDALPALARFIVGTFGKRARAIGWDARKGEADDIGRLRGRLLTLVGEIGGDRVLLTQAAKLTRDYLAWSEARDDAAKATAKPDAKPAGKTKPAPVSRENLDVVLPLGVIGGDVALYERVLARAQASVESEERQALLKALGSFRDLALVDRNVQLALAGTFEMREAGLLMRQPLSRAETRPRAWKMIQDNWDAITATVPRWAQGYMVYMAAGFCTTADHDAVAAFFADRVAAIPNGKRALAQTLEGIATCARDRDARSVELSAALRAR